MNGQLDFDGNKIMIDLTIILTAEQAKIMLTDTHNHETTNFWRYWPLVDKGLLDVTPLSEGAQTYRVERTVIGRHVVAHLKDMLPKE